MGKSKTETQEPKPKQFAKSKKAILILVAVLLPIIITLSLLAYFKPTVAVEFLETPKLDIKLKTKTINSETEVGTLLVGADETTLFEFPKGDSFIGKSYSYKSDNFEEGDNTIKACRYLDLFFIRFVSSKCVTEKFFVDRIAPEFELAKHPNFILLESSLSVDILTDDEITTYIDDVLYESESDSQKVSLPLKTGENSFAIQIQDLAGNLSEPQSVNVEAFVDSSYEKRTCGKIVVPLHKTEITGYNCTEGEIFATLGKHVNPCSGPCGYIPEYISLRKAYTQNKAAQIKALTTQIHDDMLAPTKVLQNTSFTTKTGLSGTRIVALVDTIESGIHYQDSYIFEVNGILYHFEIFTHDTELTTSAKAWSAILETAVSYAIVE